jgi:hypothetical protein
MDAITEKTNIRLFDVIVISPFLVGGIIWLSVMNSKVEALTEQKSEEQLEKKEVRQMFTEIRERLIRLEEQTKQGR